ncbi:MAG: TonB-dependent receptor [Flavobacteriales bacterium]|nr:TonB-dependent receptor [Flavobacteriales bacterium]
MKKELPILFIFLLSSLMNHIMAQTDSTKVFALGEVVIQSPKSTQTDSSSTLSINVIEKMNSLTVSEALNLMPGITQSTVGARNESMVYVRGFDLRQIPVYIDGVPVYVPYDGYVDLARFTTFDLSQVQVSKGGSSVLYGANTLGGAINLVSRKPEDTLEIDGTIGWLSGGHRANLNMGARIGKFYTQIGVSQYKRNDYPLSENFQPTANEDAENRDNSYNEDNKISLKLGYVTDNNSEYSIGYTRQQGTKGTPVYAGNDSLNSLLARPRFWQWPHWNKQSLYFISKTVIKPNTYLKTRLFYDDFDNELKSYDDATYSTQNRPYAFTSIYDDHSIGGALEFGTLRFKNHFLKVAAHYKKDVHQEYGPEDPRLTMSDYTTSFGVEDGITVSKNLDATLGLNYNTRASIRADNIINDEILSFPNNQSQAINGQLNLTYRLDSVKTVLFATMARKTRFATLKDRYSYRLGTTIPNPELKPENAWNFELGMKSQLASYLVFEPTLFYSAIQDVIQMVNNVTYDSDTDTWVDQQQNTGKASFYGAELALNYSPFKKMKTGLNYTFIKRENLSNPDIYFTNVPENKLFAFAEYRFKKDYWLLASFEYNSERYSTSYGTIASDYALLNTKMHTAIWKYLALEAGINNILDKNYAFAEGYPEQGRNYFISMKFKY